MRLWWRIWFLLAWLMNNLNMRLHDKMTIWATFGKAELLFDVKMLVPFPKLQHLEETEVIWNQKKYVLIYTVCGCGERQYELREKPSFWGPIHNDFAALKMAGRKLIKIFQCYDHKTWLLFLSSETFLCYPDPKKRQPKYKSHPIDVYCLFSKSCTTRSVQQINSHRIKSLTILEKGKYSESLSWVCKTLGNIDLLYSSSDVMKVKELNKKQWRHIVDGLRVTQK